MVLRNIHQRGPASRNLKSRSIRFWISTQCKEDEQCNTNLCKNGKCVNCQMGADCATGLCVQGVCARPTKCSDGTPIDSCSGTKPNYCNSQGELSENAQLCGCPDNFIFDKSSNSCISSTCSDGTVVGACSNSDKGKICNSDRVLKSDPLTCGCPAGQKLNGSSCIAPQAIQNINLYDFTSYENGEPYYSTFCDKIDPLDLNVRQAASDAIRNDPGSYSSVGIRQLFDIYDWVKANVIYQTVPLAGIPYPPSQTLSTRSGDCKNQAVLIASMVEAIGGTAKVVVEPACHHAYTIVYYGESGRDMDSFVQAVSNHYGKGVTVSYFTHDNGYWIIFDPAGGTYPGDTLPECKTSADRYYIQSCLSCGQQYVNSPYTYNGKCYSQCPSGTFSQNQHSCEPCPAGSYSWNNKCLTCDSGYVLGEDGRCYPQCGAPNRYCITGYCSDGECWT